MYRYRKMYHKYEFVSAVFLNQSDQRVARRYEPGWDNDSDYEPATNVPW